MHLFLEGPVQTGKSTLIRQAISPYIDHLGGFSSQRLWQDGRPCGYRLLPAHELQLDAPYAPGMSGIFMYHHKDTSFKNPDVFATLGVKLLEESAGKKLILLDELGGSELLLPAFRSKLYEILEGPIPCLGVLKLPSKAKFMSRAAGYPGQVVQYNLQLRQTLSERSTGRILGLNSENREALRQELSFFLDNIFL